MDLFINEMIHSLVFVGNKGAFYTNYKCLYFVEKIKKNMEKKIEQNSENNQVIKDRDDGRYPVDKIPEQEKATERNVEKEVEKINPTTDSLGKR